MRIGIFGGTFNPPHVGHLNIVGEFIRAYKLEKVLIIPTYTPPHKTSPNLASPEDRLEMCRLTFQGDVFEISGIEIERGGKSYTHDTLLELCREDKDAKFYFLVGDDMLTTFHEWKNPNQILDLCTIVAAVRSDNLTTDELLRYVCENYPEEYSEGRFEFLEMKPLELSSTEVRNAIGAKQSIDSLVTKETAKYIENRGLYYAKA